MSRPQVQVRVWCSAYPKCEYNGYRFEKNAHKPCPRCDSRVIESRTEPRWWDPTERDEIKYCSCVCHGLGHNCGCC